MILNAASLVTFGRGIDSRFKAGLRSAPGTDVTRFATVVQSTTAIQEYPMTVFLDTMRKWVGPRQLGALSVKNLQVANDDYEATVQIPCNMVKDDNYGIFGDVAESKGRQCTALWPKLGIASLCANGNWLDGKTFFATDRKFAGSTINNKGTAALSQATYRIARAAMMAYAGFDGEPLEIVPDLLVVGPALEETAKAIVGNSVRVATVATGESTYVAPVAEPNPNYGTAELLVTPRLSGTYANYWFLMCTTFGVKPVLVQKREEGPLVQLTKETDSNVFFGSAPGSGQAVAGGVYIFGAHYRGAAVPTLPQLCYGGIVSA